MQADNARLQAHVTQLSSLLQASEARRSSAEAAANRAAVALEAAAREKAALLDAAATAKVALMQASAKENAKLSLELARMRTANASLEMHLRTLESPGAGGPAGAGTFLWTDTQFWLHPVVMSLHKGSSALSG
jgi:hypothetical protein